MPVGWMTALKLVPWGDVIEATPQIVQAARRLLGASRRSAEAAAQAPEAGPAAPSPEETMAMLLERVQRLEAEQQASAQLIQSLAEQNAQLVRTVDSLRVLGQRLAWGVGALGVGLAGLAAWAAASA
ncbi:hypothetical protein M4R22_07610 [Acidovorax sp. GBBC 3334]|uniref:hypothetical protein n=1 Tax=Acidovorax sp. GBBC 3334 TaxID=2940496 RepID=UPI002303D873|nr:hypothetical protein [Acidovorax sp. GBBC 3334]MDA8454625.1 hypothetical protein [Acidovorax sp. GBBC 3334]